MIGTGGVRFGRSSSLHGVVVVELREKWCNEERWKRRESGKVEMECRK